MNYELRITNYDFAATQSLRAEARREANDQNSRHCEGGTTEAIPCDYAQFISLKSDFKFVFWAFLGIWLLLGFCPAGFCGNNVQETFKKANEAYRLNHFKDAAFEYEGLITQGYKSGELYFNMGNTYYRMNKMPNAILYYERARLFMPGDEDLKHNLQLANLSVTDKIEALPELSIITFFHSILSYNSSSSWAKWAVIFLWLSIAIVALYLFSRTMALRKVGFYGGLFTFLISLTCFFFAQRRQAIEEKKYAIIFAPVSYVKSSPEDNGKDAFYIHSGTKVEIKDRLGDWISIRIIDGKTGWMKRDEAEGI